MVKAINQTTREAVTAAHAVDDIPDLILLGNIEVLAVIQACRPAVPVGTVALTKRDGDALHVRIAFQDLISECFVFFAVQLAGFNVHIDRNFERFLYIFLVGDRHIDILCKLSHDLAGLLAILPEVLAVVEVTGDGDVPLLCFLDGLQAEFHRGLADGWGDTRDMEPIHTLERSVPVDITGLCKRNRRICAVIDDLARQLVRAAL